MPTFIVRTPKPVYGVFAVGANVFGAPAPVKTFNSDIAAQDWKDAQPQESARDWVIRPLTAAEIDAWVADDDAATHNANLDDDERVFAELAADLEERDHQFGHD